MNVHRHLFIALLMIVVGGLVYLLFREPVYFTRLFISDPDILPLIKLPDNAWSYILRYFLPDALWCTALLTYAATVKNRWMRLGAISMPVAMEIAQMLPFVPGTFDIIDLTIYIILTIIYTIKMKKTKITLLVNGLVLAFFAAIAMASGSSKGAVDFLDGFSDGWQEGRSYSDATETTETDSIAVEDKLFAANE